MCGFSVCAKAASKLAVRSREHLCPPTKAAARLYAVRRALTHEATPTRHRPLIMPAAGDKKKKKKQLRRDIEENQHLAPESVEKFPDGLPQKRRTLCTRNLERFFPAVLVSLLLLSLLVFVNALMPESDDAPPSQSAAR